MNAEGKDVYNKGLGKHKIVPGYIPFSLLLSFLFTQNEFAFFRGGARTYKQAMGISPAVLLGPLHSHTVPLGQDLRGHPARRRWVPVPGHVRRGSPAARPHRGRLRAPSAWRRKWAGREVGTAAALPDPRPCPGVGAHQSIAASMPWFPVRARAFSLGGRNTVSARGPWCRAGWGAEPGGGKAGHARDPRGPGLEGLPYARPLGKPISMRLSRAVSSAMTPPTPPPRGPGGTRGRSGVSEGHSRPAGKPAPHGRAPARRSLPHPTLDPPRTLPRRKRTGSGSARICLGHVGADVDGGRRESESTSLTLPPGPRGAGEHLARFVKRHLNNPPRQTTVG